MRPEAIFAPMLAFTFLVFVLWLWLGFVRVSAARRGVASMEYLSLGSGPAPSKSIATLHHHYSNLFEVPVLFYAACISLYVAGAVTGIALVFAWTFVLGRVIHTLIVLANNRPALRVGPFVLSGFAMWGMWALLLLHTLAG